MDARGAKEQAWTRAAAEPKQQHSRGTAGVQQGYEAGLQLGYSRGTAAVDQG